MNYPVIAEPKFLGVCSWLSHKLGIEVGIIRVLFVVTFIFGFGSPLLFYFFLAFIKMIL